MTVPILAILQARMSSTRLPGKVLKPLLGQPMLLRHMERLRRSRTLGLLLVATTDHDSDTPLAQLCADHGIPCFRGAMDDVLDRFWQAAAPYAPEHIVRLTGDCPLADPEVIDRVVAAHLDGGFDYTSNTLTPTWPDGLDVEVVRAPCLHQAWTEAELPSEREHVTPFVKTRPERFRLHNVVNDRNLSALRWTVDEPEDFAFVERVYGALYPHRPDFGSADILDLLARDPAIADLNANFERDAGYRKTLLQDAQFLAGKEHP
ncbi:MAG TPA: glycosyltransferase family protein [Magnetospirillum sp.]|nr:glycosyltransferase family protein [Magnetospirillum sp.]